MGRRVILEWILKKWDGGMDWIDLSEDRERWGALNGFSDEPGVSLNMGNFFTSRGPVSYCRRTVQWS
jgi:hypothetical protein